MRKFCTGLILGLIVGVALGWFGHRQWQRTDPAESERVRTEAARAVDAAGETLARVGETLRAKAEALNLRPEQVREELARTGQVVRRQTRELVDHVADATADATTTTKIKAKLAADRELSVWAINVSTTDGRVTLAGKVASEEHLARAMTLALETDGVVDVTANLKVEPGR